MTNHLGSSLAVLPIAADGSLGAVSQLVTVSGPIGPHRIEQKQSKPHFDPFDPLRWPAGVGPETLRLVAGDRIEVDADPGAIAPRCAVEVRVHRVDGGIEPVAAVAAVETRLEVQLLRDGGVIPSILRKAIVAHGPVPLAA